MNKFYLIIVSLITILFTGCSNVSNGLNPFQETKKVYGFSFIQGKVLEVFGDKVIIEIEDKDVVIGNSYEDKLTNKIIKNSLLITGMKTYIGKETAYIEDVRKNQITFKLEQTSLSSEDVVKIYIPKKTIAIMDFSLIGMSHSGINKFAMEDMTTKLVQSGQYIVVERAKLDTVLKEHKLADSGLMNKESSSKIGKLVAANLILTGSFAKQNKVWNVNLRLVDVSSGIIISAINDKIDVSEFRPKQALDNAKINETFETKKQGQGWVNNMVNKWGARSKSSIDNQDGANGTQKSLKINYFLPKEKSKAIFVNMRMRDLSAFKGIRFFAKAKNSATISLSVHDQNYDDSSVNRWNTLLNISSQWREYKISFAELVLNRFYAKNFPGGDGKFDLDNVESIAFVLPGRMNDKNQNGTVWLDEISFY